eukprot:4087921-Pyramimonas_sp.AAC.1
MEEKTATSTHQMRGPEGPLPAHGCFHALLRAHTPAPTTNETHHGSVQRHAALWIPARTVHQPSRAGLPASRADLRAGGIRWQRGHDQRGSHAVHRERCDHAVNEPPRAT